MKLLSCIVAHDRLELTRRCVDTYISTVSVPHYLTVVDTGSTDGTRPFLGELYESGRIDDVLFSAHGYPGPGCNDGWKSTLRFFGEATHLHRSDNDVEFLPGWCDEVSAVLARNEGVGQVGLMLEKYERGCGNVGGNSVILREIWDAGVRWYEQPWEPGVQEDGRMSDDVLRRGYGIARVGKECIVHHGWDFDDYPDYYTRSAVERGLSPEQLRAIFEEMKSR